jgi:hypothetical protein
MTLFRSPGYLEVRSEEGKAYIIFDWSDFSIPLAEIQKAHQAALDAALASGIRSFVAECSRARDSLLPEVIAWWRSSWVPRLVAAGIRIVSVEPRNALSMLSSRDWQRGTEAGLEVAQVGTLDEAEALARRIGGGDGP